MELSVIIPVFNEAKSIREIIRRVQDMQMVGEIVVVDDGSHDGTREILTELNGKGNLRRCSQRGRRS